MTAEWVAVPLDDDDDITAAIHPEDIEEALRFFRGARNGLIVAFGFWACVGVAVGVAVCWVVFRW